MTQKNQTRKKICDAEKKIPDTKLSLKQDWHKQI